MQSIHSMDNKLLSNDKSEHTKLFTIEPEMDESNNRGFLGVSIILLVIYIMTSRPALYASLNEWLSQLYTIKIFIN